MEDTQQDVNVEVQESSPEPVSAQPQETEQQPKEEAKSPEPQLPFHEHPRFKELIEQKNQYSEQLRNQELQMARLQAQLEMLNRSKEPQKPSEPEILRELEQVHPEFAKLMRETYGYKNELESTKKALEEIRSWRAQQEQTSLKSQFENTVSKLADEYKVPEKIRDRVRALAEAEIIRSGANMQDVPKIYKAQAEQITQFLAEYDREIRSSYVSNKAKDSASPATAKGAPASPPQQKYSANKEEALAQVVKQALQAKRAASGI